ncbi:putative mitochondrial 28S ribosomal protein S34 [Dioscorea sansibarensis]
MAAALVSRATVGLSLRFAALVKALSTSTAIPSHTVADSENKTKLKRKKKNLFEIAQFLPNWGIGYKLAKSHWRDVSYQLTKINLYKDGRHGKAWGIRYKAGLQVTDGPVKLSGVNKPGWRYIPESNEKNTSVPKVSEQSLT